MRHPGLYAAIGRAGLLACLAGDGVIISVAAVAGIGALGRGLLGQAARIAEQALTAAGWGPFRVSQGVWVAAEHDGVSASFDNDPSATETDSSLANALVYFLAGACVP